MDRRACADLPALALQLLLTAHPQWKGLPAAVVDEDQPQGSLLWVNDKAWRRCLRPGMRYASALSLERNLRAGVVAAGEIDAAVTGVTTALRRHTPHVEPSREEPGLFWLDANGLERLYASVEGWARAVAGAIRQQGFEARLVVGFTRFGTYALARSLAASTRTRLLICQSEQEERRLVREVPLERLGIDAKLRDTLARLGVRLVGDFLDLPGEGIRRRFGEEALTLHRRARGDTWDPLTPLAPEEVLARSLLLEDPVADTGILLFLVRRLLTAILQPLAAREQAALAVTVRMYTSLRRNSPPLAFTVRTAEPTLEEGVLADLVRLRLDAETRSLRRGSTIVEIEVEAEAGPAPREQLRLFQERTRRDLAAGGRALARLRAELGEGSVVRAVPCQGHLPEASYSWEPVDRLSVPSPRVVLSKPLVRRVHARPVILAPKPFRERDDCWIASVTAGHGRVESMTDPYIVSGGWWNREIHREYHYARTENGEILWVYYDRPRRRWFLAGQVE